MLPSLSKYAPINVTLTHKYDENLTYPSTLRRLLYTRVHPTNHPSSMRRLTTQSVLVLLPINRHHLNHRRSSVAPQSTANSVDNGSVSRIRQTLANTRGISENKFGNSHIIHIIFGVHIVVWYTWVDIYIYIYLPYRLAINYGLSKHHIRRNEW